MKIFMRRFMLILASAFLVMATSGGSPAQSQTANTLSAPIAFRVDEFRSATTVRITEIAGKTIVGILKRAIERNIRTNEDAGFVLSTTASLSLSGFIQELTIDDRRRDATGSPLERLARIRIDFTVLDEESGRDVVERKNLIQEFNYYTDTYSLEQGLNDREALEERLLVELANRIMLEVTLEKSKLPVSAPRDTAPRQKLDIPEDEMEILRGAEQPSKPQKNFSWIFNFADEAINIPEGTLASSGQNQPTTNRFTQTTTFKLEPFRIGEAEMRGVAIGKYESRDVRQLSLQRGELEYLARPDHLFRFGTVSATLNRYVFDQTLAGAAYDGSFKHGIFKHNLMAIGGHDFRPNGIGDLSRLSYGGSWEVLYKDIASVKVLGNATRDQDLATVSGAFVKVDNQMYGLSGGLKTPFGSELEVDLARSFHQEVRRPGTPLEQGDLIDVKLSQEIKDLTLEAYYYNADQRFRTIYGSATSDREKSGVTAFYPGTIKWIDYALSGEISRANRVSNRTNVDILALSNLNLIAKPFKTSKHPYLSEIAFTGDYYWRRSYEDAKVQGTTAGNNRENNKFSFNFKNTFWKEFSTSVTWDDERERDKLKRELRIIQELRWENSFVRSITDELKVELKGNYRARDGGIDQDRFTTFGSVVTYERNQFTGRFDYLRDLKRGTVKAQDSTKDRFTLDLSHTHMRGSFKNTLTLRGDYEINDFDLTLTDHHRWTTFLEMKVIF